ncbi:transforming acidic coiled-coil-containing protein 1 isoform X1 [Rattus norvegicus]|uniref:transforming acidic coiled-coil-containing protein 1 isoform X1 n=1 Tax=Rattus norvegicus TaxID=10116 RepID=UPI0003D0B145|nr:transforming acidic coiled-coil-containing protein 1 isoform X1 [Rattus norvegicus]|eukprot:XP_017455635.1 PREDICTED: transforming acidic coiled-coil-containing protein 1 isoform X2 [Rattus norvegicus]
MGGSHSQGRGPGLAWETPPTAVDAASDSEGNFETPEAETPIRSSLKESCDSSLGLSEPEAKPQESREADEQPVAELIEKCSPDACSRSSGNEAPQATIDSYSVKDVRGKAEHDVSKISVVRPFSIETRDCTDDPAAHGCVPVLPGKALPSTTPEATQDQPMMDRGMGVTLEAFTEVNLKTGGPCPEPVPSRSRLRKPKPVSLRKKTAGDNTFEPEMLMEGSLLPKASSPWIPEESDKNSNPSLLRGLRAHKSPLNLKEAASIHCNSAGDSGVDLQEGSRASPLKLDDFTEDGRSVETRSALPKQPGRKPSHKLAPNIRKDGSSKPVGVEQLTDPTIEDASLAQTSPKLDPSKWGRPNFNSFGSCPILQSSPPVSSKGSYHLDPDNVNADESGDPCKPATALTGSGFCSATGNHVNEILDSPKKAQSRLITTSEQVKFLCFLLSGCKVKKYETQSLDLDACSQDEGAVISQIADIPNRDGHATDEEKLASTSCSQKSAGAEVKGVEKEAYQKMEEEELTVHGLLETSSEKAPVSVACGGESPLDGICLSEADKTAVLTLIREEIITKEIEANEWKKKYEETREEVLEMRKIVAEYEKTIAQMIEDEQRTNMSSQKSFQQLTMEKEQALADLNSVERSLSDLFRRYENLKGVLEGFKKNEEALKKCAQDYLARVKQEEQRYQALKVHAEEKLDRANEEIAQVRSKAKAESAALHAGLRREQMKVESLERALQQKNQEIEELTKICDELIAKLGKAD